MHQANRSGASRGGNHANRTANLNGGRGAHANTTRNANLNGQRNVNTNRNVNANRNVNVNRDVNVNVNRDVDVHGVGYWGRPAIAAPRYYWPHGYHYVHAPIGYVLPHAFLAPAYYYSAWASLGLMAPPVGQQWVRYGPDLLLVDTASGNVIDVRYGVFQE